VAMGNDIGLETMEKKNSLILPTKPYLNLENTLNLSTKQAQDQ
jgi:hypothetical protein